MKNSSSAWNERRFVYTLILLFSAAAFVRLFPVISADFPINDGGLFTVMSQDLLDADFALPAFTTYNGGIIPYGYPPLAFYITAFISRIFKIPVIDLIQYLPGIISVLTVPAFYGLCRAFPFSPRQVLFAVLAYSFIPRSFGWLIMGGGITRSFGMVFAILALRQIILLYKSQNSGRILIFTIIFSSLTILTHAETGWFVVVSAGVFFLFSQNGKNRIINSLWVVLGVTLMTSPWWGMVIYRHGLNTFTAAFRSGYQEWYGLHKLVLNFADESFVTFFSAVAVIGFFLSLQKRDFFFPIWFLVTLYLIPRSGANYVIIVVALLFSFGLDQSIIFAFRNQRSISSNKLFSKLSISIENIFLVFVMIYTFFAALFFPAKQIEMLDTLSSEQRDAIHWITSNTSSKSTFLIVTADSNVWTDQTSEWFPVLSGRISLSAVQGYEWLPGQIGKRYKAYNELQQCAYKDLECLLKWQDVYGYATHVFLPKNNRELLSMCCASLVYSLECSDLYRKIYDRPGATIYEFIHLGDE